MLGTDPDYIWVPHPIQDRTDAELQAMADKYLDEILAAITCVGESKYPRSLSRFYAALSTCLVIAVATEQFVQAAATQAAMLGTDPDYIWVPHPIQDRTDAELQAMADKYLDEILAAMTRQVERAA